ncbi:MAG: PAS domain S-box protein [Balneolales bacterium]|nr:PAS domain S-box protein [Balneolales bacterium]
MSIQNYINNKIPSWLNNSHQIAMLITDMKGVILNVNDCFIERYPFLGNPIGKNFTETMYPEDIQICINAVENCLRNSFSGKASIVNLRKLNPETGEILTTKWELSPIVENDQAVGILSVGVDQTIYQRAKQAQFISEKKYELVSDYISDGIIGLRLDGSVFYVSEAYKKIFSHSNEVLSQMNRDKIFAMIHPEDRDETMSNIMRAIENQNSELLYEYRFLHKNGNVIWREDHARFLFDDNDSFIGAFIVCRDISDRKQKEKFLELQNNKLREIARVHSHELRAPVAKLLSLTDLLQDSEQETFSAEQLIDLISETTQSLDVIIHQIEDEIHKDNFSE